MAINIVNFPIQYMNLMASIGMRKTAKAMGKAAPLLKPIGWLGSLISTTLSLLLIPTVIVSMVVAGIKVAIRSRFGIRSEYQKATPLSVPSLEAPKGSTARLMALRDPGFCAGALHQQHEAKNITMLPKTTFRSSSPKVDSFDLDDFDLPSGLSFRQS